MLRHGSVKGKPPEVSSTSWIRPKRDRLLTSTMKSFFTVGFYGEEVENHTFVCVCVLGWWKKYLKVFSEKNGLGNENSPMFLGEKHFRG